MTPFFSIIIPVYNVAPYLRECLDSVLAQTFTDWEAICVDDGSTDGSGAILDEYAAKDNRVVVIHRANEGVSKTRNVGMKSAKGEWMLYLDADDVLVKDGLEELYKWLSTDKYDALFTGDPIVFKNEAPQKAIGSNSVIKVIENSSRGTELLFSDKPLWGYPFIRVLRKSLFQNVEFPVGIPNMEDSISLIDVLAVEARWIWVDLQIYGYRVREGSACRLITPEKVKAIIPCFTRMFEDARLKLGCPAPVARRLMKQYRESMCYYLYEIIHSASTSELKDIASLYKRHVEVVGIHTANIFLRLRMSISRFSGRRLFRLIDIIEWLWFGSRSRFKRLLTKLIRLN